MKNSGKTKVISAIVSFLLMASLTLLAMPVKAQTLPTQSGTSVPLPAGVTPDFSIDTHAYLSFTPNPVGLGQSILVNIWIYPSTIVARNLAGYKVTITKPDGTTDVITKDSYEGDATAWFEYVVDQVGNWTLKFEFPGGYFPAGIYHNPYNLGGGYGVSDFVITNSSYYKPSSTAEQTLTVQTDPVSSWPASALPTDYWTRPVSPENREWSVIMGDYPWFGVGGGSSWPADTNTYASGYDFTPYVQAPNTAHIVWKQQGALSGLGGGSQGIQSMTSGGGTPSIIYQGRAYQSYSKPGSGSSAQTYWECYDIRTGKLFWERPLVSGESAPTIIEYSESTQTSGTAATLVAISGGKLMKYNPWTGALSVNVSIAPLSSATYYMNGYALSLQNVGTFFAPSYRLINWTTFGSSTDVTTRICGNVSWPETNMAVFGIIGHGIDYETGVAVCVNPDKYVMSNPLNNVYNNATATWTGTVIAAMSLTTGQLLWNKTIDQTTYTPLVSVADHGKIAALMSDGGFLCWDLITGKLLWTSEAMDYPWSEPGFGAYDISSAYGMIYRAAYDGVYAFDWDTGKIVWHYEAPTPYAFETPYTDASGVGVYSFNGAMMIADGKIYTYNTEHSATQPITRGWRLHCIDATTGEGIWNITGSMSAGAVADGYLAASNCYDGYMYVFGKGKSATTIEAPLTTITQGQSVVLKGTVLDMSPGQSGTPCVSAESMAGWMEYLHMQKSIPASVTGVPVSLDALDSNGNWQHIGDVTTDGLTGTFGFIWEPEITGKYTVTATFMGDDSYGSSFATTYVGVTEAPAATATPEPAPAPIDYTLTIVGMGIAIMLVVAIATILILRKR